MKRFAATGEENSSAALTQVSNEALHEKVYERIVDALTSGNFSPGQPLTIRALAEQLGVSPTPVREALRRLVAERALEVRSNRTFRVPLMTAERFGELAEIRDALEGAAAERAASRITTAELEHLVEINAELGAHLAPEDTPRSMELNKSFHHAVYAAADAPDLIRMLEILWLLLGPYHNYLKQFDLVESAVRDSLDVHQAVIDGLHARDGAAAAAAIRADIQSSSDLWVTYAQDSEAPPLRRLRGSAGRSS